MEWRDPSKLSALTATMAKDLLASKKAQPRYAQDKRHFKLALETFLDDTKMEEWKEQALSELEEKWREERGVEKMKKEEAEKFKVRFQLALNLRY
ncbi:hypothetical protein BCR35DRAFT_120382 [Leucosporidium creatinivorum]|uniref:Uncharacterized protein n=1 Tax=Leucosporidium creatinivorum TaxID=106004 RepID=A0A1Y2EY82_9BASI|nr:hypothetical protein BCR35DRAFT_120382 [Leucosporidium creatinivorum]